MKVKLLVFMCFLLVGLCSKGYGQQQVSLREALSKIQSVYGTKFSFEEHLLDGAYVTLKEPLSPSEKVEQVLKDILYPNGFLFLFVQNNYYTIIKDNRKARENSQQGGLQETDTQGQSQHTITGRVYDGNRQPVIGATVMPEGVAIRQGVITNSEGQYILRLKERPSAIIVTFLGMRPQRLEIGDRNVVDFVLESEQQVLEEVNVLSTGYQSVPKERATGAFGQIRAKEIKATPTVNLLERLEGLTPGLQVDLRQNKINIRGTNSFGVGTPREPLIVIDGFPMAETDDGRFELTDMVSGTVSSGAVMSRINPEDIESITVLKDAAAASIWGAKAGNGVIVIETKKGRNTPPTLNFSTNFSVSAPADMKNLDRMSAAQYIDLETEIKNKGFIADNLLTPNDSWMNFNQKAPHSEALEWMFRVDRGTATEAQRDSALAVLSSRDNSQQIRDNLLQHATSQQYNLSLSGGSNKSTYFLSGNYTKDVPIYRANKGESAFILANLDNQLFNDRVRLRTGLSYNYANSLNNPAAANAIAGREFGLRPYEMIRDTDGNLINRYLRFRPEVMQDFDELGYLDWSYNPVRELDALHYNTQANRLRFNMDLNTRLTDWMDFSVMGQLQRDLEKEENIEYLDSYAMRNMINEGTSVNSSTGRLVYGVPLGGSLTNRNYNGWQYVLRAQANINKSFGTAAEHNLTYLLGTEIRQNEYNYVYDKYWGFNEDTYDIATVNPTQTYTTVQGWSSTIGSNSNVAKNRSRALSYYSNAALAFFNNRYVLSGSVRFDDFTVVGASREQRAKPLWSVGGKWDLKQEDFLRQSAWVDALALRVTYGVNGTAPTSMYSRTVIVTSTDSESNETTAEINSPANTQVAWEKVKTLNLGMDYATWDNRLLFNVDYYTKRTSDILYNLPFNPTYGWTQLVFNSATMKGHGVDLGIRADWLRKTIGWNTQFNFAYNTNEVTDSRIEQTFLPSLLAGGSPTVGLPSDYLYAYQWAGLDANGQSQIYNKDGDIVSSAQSTAGMTVDDLRYMGRTTAPYFGALFNTFSYKNISLGVRISYELGHVIRRSSIDNYPSFGTSAYTGLIGTQSDLASRWRVPGDEMTTNVPGLINDNNQANSVSRYANSDLLVISGSHVRLQQIDLGYRFPTDKLQRSPFKSLSVSGSVRNLGILWRKNKEGVDPVYRYTNNYSNLPPTPAFFLSISSSF